MEKLKEILAAHLKTNIVGCDCGWAALGVRHTDHLAEMLKPLLAEVWDAGWDNRDRNEFEPWDTTNPYEESA